MRIAVLSCFYPYRGGISQFNACIYDELGKCHDVKAFNFKRQYPEFLFPGKTQYVENDDTSERIDSDRILDTVNPFSYIRTARKIREWKPDLLIIRYWMSFFAPSLGYVARKLKKDGCRVIGILDNVVPHEKHFFDRPLTKYFLNGCNAYITLCDAVARDLLSIKPDARYMTTPHPLYSHFGEKLARTEAEDMLGINHGMRNILFFGLIREYKGLDILIRAFGKLDGTYQLIVAGEPYGSFEKYAKLIDESPAKERIHLYPQYIKDNEVNRYFSAADICVLPYRSATQSGISSVSYHFDLPMITTDVGGLKESIGDRGTGIVVESPDPGLIASAITGYFASPENAIRMKGNILREKERLSWKTFCDRLLDFYKTI